jgi:hypothetical protein
VLGIMIQDRSTTDAKPAMAGENANLPPTPSDDVEKALDADKASTELSDEQEYPPMRNAIAIIISLYLAIFLVSLVSLPARRRLPSPLLANMLPGPDNHCHSCAQCVPTSLYPAVVAVGG